MLQGLSYTKSSISFVIDNKPYVINNDHPSYTLLLEAIKNEEYDKLPKLVNVNNAVAEYAGAGGVKVVNGVLTYKGEEVHNSVSKRILEMMKEGFKFDYMVKFLENLLQNPSKRSVEQLYGFLDQHNIPITPDGHFLAYKAVRSDFTDKHTGTIDNSVGKVVELPRNKVDDDFRNECSYGLHVGGLAYSGPNGWFRSEGDRVVICKVNPRDCVSVPDDHNRTKLRVCKYEVIGEYVEPLSNTVQNSTTRESFETKLFTGDLVDFIYYGDYRCGWVNSVDDNYLTLELDESDSSYNSDIFEAQIRKFFRDKIKDLEVLD